MVKERREEEFTSLLRLVPELWALMGADTLACVRDCLAVFTGVASDDDTAASLLPALQRRGLLSAHNVLVLRQVSELVGCGGALRLLDDFQRRHPPQPARPAPGQLTLSTELSVSSPAESSGDSRQQSPATSSDSFRSALGGTERGQERCPWVWPRVGDTGRQGPLPAQHSVRDVLERRRDEMERPRNALDQRLSPDLTSPGVQQEQMHWLEKVLTWDVHPEPADTCSGPELTSSVSRILSRDSDVHQRSGASREDSQLGSERWFTGYVTCC